MKSVILLLTLCFSTFLGSPAHGGDDPSIKGKTREDIQSSMVSYIKSNSVEGKFIVYDAVTDELKRLTFKKLHSGIVKKGEFYVSCVDFVDENDNKYDIDYLVMDKDGVMRVLQSIVHSINGEKRKYHVE